MTAGGGLVAIKAGGGTASTGLIGGGNKTAGGGRLGGEIVFATTSGL